MKVAVIGIGALGCLFGARLGEVAKVTMVGSWREQREAIEARGLWVDTATGERRHYRPRVVRNAAAAGPADVALVVLKSHQRAAAAGRASAALGPVAGLALSLQNGLGHREHLARAVGAHRVAAGVTSEGARVVAPGHLFHAGAGITRLAPPEAAPPEAPPEAPAQESESTAPPEGARNGRETLEAFARCLRRAGFTTEVVDSVEPLVWGKLAVNAAINPLTALLGVVNGQLAQNEDSARWVGAVAEEVAFVARAAGVAVPYQQVGDAAAAALAVCRNTAANRSSMLQDVDAERRTEIDAICGAVVETASAVGVEAPLNALLWRRIAARGTRASALMPNVLEAHSDKAPSVPSAEAAELHRWLDHRVPTLRIRR